jgi:phosphatidylglycerol:prolipoprotein diacylglycerol transferase
MAPRLFGFTSYFLFWMVAAGAGIFVAVRDAHRANLPLWKSLLAACVLAVTIVLGSKLLFMVEHRLLSGDPSLPWEQASFDVRSGFRIPGGILLFAVTLPLICRLLRLPALQFADLSFPAIGAALVFIRIGCFLNGCCFGAPTTGPLAITFPPGTPVHAWQASQGLIAPQAPHTLPVHPLQLYFALLGLAVYLVAVRLNKTKRFDGQVWVASYLVFFGGTFLLEFLRPRPLHLNLALCAAVVLVTGVVGLRAWRRAKPTAIALTTVPLRF